MKKVLSLFVLVFFLGGAFNFVAAAATEATPAKKDAKKTKKSAKPAAKDAKKADAKKAA